MVSDDVDIEEVAGLGLGDDVGGGVHVLAVDALDGVADLHAHSLGAGVGEDGVDDEVAAEKLDGGFAVGKVVFVDQVDAELLVIVGLGGGGCGGISRGGGGEWGERQREKNAEGEQGIFHIFLSLDFERLADGAGEKKMQPAHLPSTAMWERD